MSEPPTNFIRETNSFEAFDLVTEALEQIDSYDPEKNNVEVLQEARDYLTKALADNADPQYRKAQYLQAIVHYLENNPGKALSQFERMGRITPESAFGKEVAYNIAAAYSALGDWSTAISRFDEVLKITQPELEKNTNNDSEVRLLTHAGMAFSYAGRVRKVRDQLNELENQDSDEAKAVKKRNEQEAAEHLRLMEDQYELARGEALRVSDQDIVRESEQIFRDAYMEVEGQKADRIIKLVAGAPERKRRIFTKKRIIVFIFLFLMSLAFVQIYWGWDHVFRLTPAN